MKTTRNHFGRDRHRRGMLLLMVLSMLTLFLLMGTLAIVMATRSRESARAFATAAAGPSQRAALARQMANEALLILIRGSTDPITRSDVTESLLGDMYDDLDSNGNRQRDATGNVLSNYPSPFVDESFDAFDGATGFANPFLTQVTLNSNGQVTDVPKPSFQKTGTNARPCEVDNDGDGIADGIWLTNALPSVTMPNGDKVTFNLSYMVLDLDSRLNVNAHGKGAGTSSTALNKDVPQAGPADVGLTPTLDQQTNDLILSATGGPQPPSTAPPSIQWRRPPQLGGTSPTPFVLDGRFGRSSSTNTYALRLDLEALRPAILTSATTQNPFTLGELERVLRQFDTDASTLPPRLAAVLSDRAQRLRMRVTTDSWDLRGDRTDIEWQAHDSGAAGEKVNWSNLCDSISRVNNAKNLGIPLNDIQQWVANIIEFRDTDNGNTNFDTGSTTITGVEPRDLSPIVIPGGDGGWDKGYFLSVGQVFAVPMGTASDIKTKLSQIPPQPAVSLATKYPQILEAMIVPSLFKATTDVDPKREPGRVNVNTCDNDTWTALLGQQTNNPFSSSAAKSIGDVLANTTLVFNGDPTGNVLSLNHQVANRLAGVATVRSNVFAVWISIQVTNTSPTGATSSCHRLFAIVDRSIPAVYAEGQNNNVTNTIRLQRFLN